jgi:hypothetical protein
MCKVEQRNIQQAAWETVQTFAQQQQQQQQNKMDNK